MFYVNLNYFEKNAEEQNICKVPLEQASTIRLKSVVKKIRKEKLGTSTGDRKHVVLESRPTQKENC